MFKNLLLGLLGLLFVGAIVFFGARLLTGEDNWICQNGVWVKHGNPSGPMPTGTCKEGEQVAPQKEPTQAATPNPAAKNCLDKGGKLENLQETAGQLAICKFPDGSECEEWQFFRGECQKGQYSKADTSHPYQGRISKTAEGLFFKDISGTEYTLELPSNAKLSLKERLTAESLSKDSVTIVAAENPPLSKKLILKSFQEK